METSELTQVESSAVDLYTKDGGGEVLVAGLSIVFAVAAFLDLSGWWFNGLLLVIAGGIWVAGALWHNKITYPRVGYAVVKREIRSRLKAEYAWRAVFVIAATYAILFGIHILGRVSGLYSHRLGMKSYPRYDPGSAFFTTLMIAAAFSRNRKHTFILMFWGIVLRLISEYFYVNPAYGMILTAAIALVIGIRKLRLFLRENPRLDQEVADERTV